MTLDPIIKFLRKKKTASALEIAEKIGVSVKAIYKKMNSLSKHGIIGYINEKFLGNRTRRTYFLK